MRGHTMLAVDTRLSCYYSLIIMKLEFFFIIYFLFIIFSKNKIQLKYINEKKIMKKFAKLMESFGENLVKWRITYSPTLFKETQQWRKVKKKKKRFCRWRVDEHVLHCETLVWTSIVMWGVACTHVSLLRGCLLIW